MVDAQGERIQSAGNRRLFPLPVMEAVWSLSNSLQGVTHPLVPFGVRPHKSQDQDDLFLDHEVRSLQVPAGLERNLLVMDVKVCNRRKGQ